MVMVPTTFVRALNSLAAAPKHQLRKALPDKILVAYTTNKCNDDMTKVTEALRAGVNVLIWSFISFEPKDNTGDGTRTSASNPTCNQRVQMKTELDVSKYRRYRKQLSLMGYSNVVHLVAFGGWNGPHILSGYSSKELYDAFNAFNMQHNDDMSEEPLFDGIDWDLEGKKYQYRCATLNIHFSII